MAKEDRNEKVSKITQMINALPDKDIDALERVVWSMSRSSDRVSVYKGHERFRIYLSFTALTSALGFQIDINSLVEENKDKILFVVYSDVKILDQIRGKQRKIITEEMKTLISGYGVRAEILELMHFTTDSPKRNERTIVDPDLFQLSQIVRTIDS